MNRRDEDGRDAVTDHQRVPLPAITPVEFAAFYREALPQVYGYAVRLCGGDEPLAWDLTQDAWTGLVDQLRGGRREVMTVRWLITTVRSRFVDQWRRQERLNRKLALVWAADRSDPNGEGVSMDELLEHVDACSPRHRTVLLMAYVDEMPVATIASELDCSTSKVYALLERARAELRRLFNGGLA